MGPAPGVQGLYVIGGCCAGGLSTALAFGEVLAEWIVMGRSPMDLSRMSPARFATGLREAGLLDLCRDQYAHHYWSSATMPKHTVVASA